MYSVNTKKEQTSIDWTVIPKQHHSNVLGHQQ